MRELGRWGRWGNQLFQVAFLRVYAKMHNLQVQIPPWTGKHVFGLDDPPVTVQLPTKSERRRGGPLSEQLPPIGDEFVNCNWQGYGQIHTSWYRPHAGMLRQLFQPVEKVTARFEPAINQLKSRGKTIIGIHLRLGDSGRLIFYITPVKWYLEWLNQHWDNYDSPILFIATEDRSLVKQFSKYQPCVVEDLGINLSNKPMADTTYLNYDRSHPSPMTMDFLPDYFLLSQCHILLIPESTFSFTAAMFSDHLRECWRSRLSIQKFERIDPWNSMPLVREHLDDYPGIPGTCLDETDYWRRLRDNRFAEH
jgi:hypothetical protein